MQTSVEWLVKIYLQTNKIDSFDIEQAKEMEKQQIIDAFYQCGRDNFEHIKVINRSATDYYNETYGSKGSDENFKQFSLYEHKETIATSDTPTEKNLSEKYQEYQDWLNEIPQISDEEIDMAALHNEPRVTRRAFKSGAKWYREQLKKKQ